MLEEQADVWAETVGSSEKPLKNLSELCHLKPEAPKHEDLEVTEKRRLRSLEQIYSTFKNPQTSIDGTVTAEVEGKKFDFWPATNCWYSYTKLKYGADIEKLCRLLRTHFDLDVPNLD